MSEEELMQVQEEASELNVEEAQEEAIAEASNKLPFPRAQVYRLLKSNMPDGKILRGSVKEEMNRFLGRIGAKVASKLGESKYSTIELMDFVKVTRPYEEVETLDEERKRIISSLELIQQNCESLIRDVNKHFTVSAEDLGPKKKVVEFKAEEAASEESEETSQTEE